MALAQKLSEALDIHIDTHTDYQLALDLLDAQGSAMALTGWTGTASLRQYRGGPYLSLFSVEIPGTPTNRVILTINKQTTALLRRGSYLWDLVLVNPALKTRKFVGEWLR